VSEGVNEADIFERVLGEFLFEGGRGEISEELEKLAGDGLQCSLGQSSGVAPFEQFEGGFAMIADGGDMILAVEMGLVTGVVPMREVHLGNGEGKRRVGGLLEFFDDAGVGMAIVEHGIDELAQGFRQLGHFGAAAPFGSRRLLWQSAGGGLGGLECWFRVGDGSVPWFLQKLSFTHLYSPLLSFTQ